MRLDVRERWAAVMRPDDPLAAHESVSAADLAARALILPQREAVRNELASWFGALWPGLDIRCTSNMSANAAILVREGYGVAVVITRLAALPGRERTGAAPALARAQLQLHPRLEARRAAQPRGGGLHRIRPMLAEHGNA